jgi:hypothetical protein
MFGSLHAQSVVDATAAVSSERNDLRECWQTVAASYAKQTCESPELVITAAFGKCIPLETVLRNAVEKSVPSVRAGFSTWLEGYRAGAREMLLPVIMDNRIEFGRCSSSKQ